MTMTIASPATIKSLWAVVLVPHLARCGGFREAREPQMGRVIYC